MQLEAPPTEKPDDNYAVEAGVPAQRGIED